MSFCVLFKHLLCSGNETQVADPRRNREQATEQRAGKHVTMESAVSSLPAKKGEACQQGARQWKLLGQTNKIFS